MKGGRVYGFGYCDCGSGTSWNGNRVWNIPSAGTAGVTAIAGSIDNGLALRDGGVIAWGRTESGVTAVPEAARSGVTAISVQGTALAIKDGGVIQWGRSTAPVPDAAKSGVVAVSSGGAAMALRRTAASSSGGQPAAHTSRCQRRPSRV